MQFNCRIIPAGREQCCIDAAPTAYLSTGFLYGHARKPCAYISICQSLVSGNIG